MKKSWIYRFCIIVSITISLISCGKNWLDNNIEEGVYNEVTKNPYNEFINFKIGMEAKECYDSIQSLKAMDSIAYLFVTGNIFNDVEEIDSVIELYDDLFINTEQGSPYGVQITYRSDTIKSIFLNNGTPLINWPDKTQTDVIIEVGDSVNTISTKLKVLSDDGLLNNLIFRTWNKNLNKPYDQNMGELDLWYLTRKKGEKINEIDLIFTNSILDSIISYEMIPYGD